MISIAEYAAERGGALVLYKADIINGLADGRFAPLESAARMTRNQHARITVLQRHEPGTIVKRKTHLHTAVACFATGGRLK